MVKLNNKPSGKRIRLAKGEMKKISKRLFSTLWKEYKWQIIFAIIFIILSACGMLFQQLFVGKILIDGFFKDFNLENFKNGSWTFNESGFVLMMAFSASIFAVSLVSQFAYNKIMVNLTYKFTTKLRNQMYNHLQSLPISYFDKNQKGDILAKFTSDIDTLNIFISQSLPQLINAIFTLSTSLVIMFVLNWFLAILTIILSIILFIPLVLLGAKSAKHFAKRQKVNGHLSGYAEEMISGIRVVKVFNYEEKSKNEFEKINLQLSKVEEKANIFANTLFPIAMNMGNIVFALISIIGGVILVSSINSSVFLLTIGTLVSFTQFARSFAYPISTVSQQTNTISLALAGAFRIFSILDTIPEEDNGKITSVKIMKNYETNEISEVDLEDVFGVYAWKIPLENGKFTYKTVKGDIEFKNVSFGYTNEKMILKDINLEAKQGQKIALVGPTGAGKTTITNLLNRFYDIQKGEILYDGINIKEIEKASLRRLLSVVLQETSLFTDTIKNNIAYGQNEANDYIMEDVSIMTNLTHFIQNQSHSYDTLLKDSGNELSQGQKQLFSIARASYTGAPVLILDEATSSIDTKTEVTVQNAMDKLMIGKTSFVIAHRLSTIQNSDVILVMKDGQIVERGNHDELIAKQGDYYTLWNNALAKAND
ncbi:ABC transporter ATP-binding protein [Mesomycoplasma lagogenitalium]|uniref:ABC transporter ATP-binding protein n=1 Tax=Mesomycoplasma lagogenitalium TaxID=171286 RepID=A0ABY8LTS7_9BACT|nr:ABC transporter ATP-binding protein [Mesomycoplasma lagogenitalium]WGI36647.1 ABC transporter ATP-binding protein [Mesomycoplasma lagogenitalium]